MDWGELDTLILFMVVEGFLEAVIVGGTGCCCGPFGGCCCYRGQGGNFCTNNPFDINNCLPLT